MLITANREDRLWDPIWDRDSNKSAQSHAVQNVKRVKLGIPETGTSKLIDYGWVSTFACQPSISRPRARYTISLYYYLILQHFCIKAILINADALHQLLNKRVPLLHILGTSYLYRVGVKSQSLTVSYVLKSPRRRDEDQGEVVQEIIDVTEQRSKRPRRNLSIFKLPHGTLLL